MNKKYAQPHNYTIKIHDLSSNVGTIDILGVNKLLVARHNILNNFYQFKS